MLKSAHLFSAMNENNGVANITKANIKKNGKGGGEMVVHKILDIKNLKLAVYTLHQKIQSNLQRKEYIYNLQQKKI